MLPNELAQDVRQDAAVPERDQLLRRIDARNHLKLDGHRIVAAGANSDESARREALRDTDQLAGLAARQPQRSNVLAALELQRQHAHVHEIASVNALEGLADDRFDSQEQRALGGPVARRSGSVLLA